MKKNVVPGIGLVMLLSVTGCRAPVVSIDPVLKSEASEYEVTLSASLRRAEFGPFRTSKAERDSRGEGMGIVGLEYSEKREKVSFALLEGAEGVTVSQVSSLNTLAWNEFQVFVKDFHITINRDNFFLADIVLAGGAHWALALNNANRSADIRRAVCTGELTDGATSIALREITRTDKGGSPLTGLNMLGFEFLMGDRAVAAVQTFLYNANRKTVWLRSDLPADVRSAVASACAALALKSNLDKM